MIPHRGNPLLIRSRFALCAIILLPGAVSCDLGPVPGPPAALPFPSLPRPRHLLTINQEDLAGPELLMVTVLQGMTAGREPRIYITDHGARARWLADLVENHNCTTEEVGGDAPAWALVDRFAEEIAGYSLYELGKPSANVATALASVIGALPVEVSREEDAKNHDLTLVEDLRDRDERWLLETHWSDFTHRLVFLQRPENSALRDYVVATGGFVFFARRGELMAEVFNATRVHSPVIGWGDADELPLLEASFVLPASESGHYVIPAGQARNLSVLSGFAKASAAIRQPTHHGALPSPDTPPSLPLPEVHYATLVIGDGEDDPFGPCALHSEQWYLSPARGGLPLGWTVAPTMADLAPTVLSAIYAAASPNDQFITAASGTGRLYPDRYPDLDRLATLTRDYLRRTDLRVVLGMVFEPDGFRPATFDIYTAPPEVVGVLAVNYSLGYERLRGRVLWSNGKPVVGAREVVWARFGPARSPEYIADLLNRQPRDPSSAEGYSFIVVEPGGPHTLEELKERCIDRLDPAVAVVPPETFLQLVAAHLSR